MGLAAAIVALTGCGGGGGDAAAPSAAAPASGGGGADVATTPAPSSGAGEPLTSFLVNGEGGVATLTIGLDSSGRFTQSGTQYQLQAGGPSGCTMTSAPADPSVAACNLLAGGSGFVLCENTLTPHFNYTFFRPSDVQLATHWELAGRTLTGLACGSTGPRTTSYTFTFSADGEMATEYAGGNTWGYGAGIPDLYERADGYPSAGWRERWVIYKMKSGTATQYFLLHLFQTDPSIPPRTVNLYFLQI